MNLIVAFGLCLSACSDDARGGGGHDGSDGIPGLSSEGEAADETGGLARVSRRSTEAKATVPR